MRRPARTAFAAGTLGFALGGFFDGILLHQVLQWHHFLSLLPSEAEAGLQRQVLWDGLFHVAVYAVAVFGLWQLWLARGALAGDRAAPATSRFMLVAALLGFALWQIVDVVGFHWIAGIHRIRVDVPNPLAWDLGWLAATAVPPLLLARALSRSKDAGGNAGGRAIAAGLALAVLGAAPIAARPAPVEGPTLVLFRPGAALPAAVALDARLVWLDLSGDVAALALPPGVTTWMLYRHGALLVGSAAAAGCLGWSRVGA